MTDLTIAELNDKIVQAEKDIARMRSDAGHSKQAGILEDYLDYLKDQLKDAVIKHGNS